MNPLQETGFMVFDRKDELFLRMPLNYNEKIVIILAGVTRETWAAVMPYKVVRTAFETWNSLNYCLEIVRSWS